MLELSLSLLLVLIGCALLYIGGDMLVSASTFIANRVGMSPIAIGATVVAIGTSAPEFSVSLDAALANHAGISVGNVVGSNVCNIILGSGYQLIPDHPCKESGDQDQNREVDLIDLGGGAKRLEEPA